MDLENKSDIWYMTCPGCENACNLTVYGRTLATLERVVGSHCAVGVTYAHRALRAAEANQTEPKEK